MLRGAPTANDRSRAAFLDDVCQTLWPRSGEAVAGAGTQLLLLPGRRRPRLVVPDERRAAAAAVRQYGEPRSRRSQLGVRALSLLLRSGLGGALFRDRIELPGADGAASIESYLRSEVAPDLRLSMYLGPPRANRKPVLQLLSPAGRLIGIAKIGMTPLARRLVDHEHRTLVTLGHASLAIVRPPEVLHHGSWQGMPVLVLRPLPIRDHRLALPAGRLAAAMREVARVPHPDQPRLAASDVLQSLAGRLAGADESGARSALEGVLEELAGRVQGASLAAGSWHGDWTPWNMAHTPRGLLLWDWERFAERVPIGFDAAHHWLQTRAIPGRGEPRQAAAECVARAPAVLAGLVADPAEARLTALLYLAELATRSLADGQAASGARLGDPAGWLIPALREQTAAA